VGRNKLQSEPVWLAKVAMEKMREVLHSSSMMTLVHLKWNIPAQGWKFSLPMAQQQEDGVQREWKQQRTVAVVW
jgi:hypothetical protein